MDKMIKIRTIGKGIYGRVYESKYIDDVHKDTQYAVKRNYIVESIDFCGSIKELDLLCRIKHPFFIEIVAVEFNNPFNEPHSPLPKKKSKKDLSLKDDKIHFVMEKADMDLFSVLYRNNSPKLTLDQISGYMVQLLLGIKYIHAKGIAHRDIKPANILIKNDTIKICDLGISMYLSKQEKQTPSIISSWYRPPELCYGYIDYTLNVDVWSLGCIFYELVTSEPLLKGLPDKNSVLLHNLLILFQDYFDEKGWINILSAVIKTLYVSTSVETIYENIIVPELEFDSWWEEFNAIFKFIKSKLDNEWNEIITESQENFTKIKFYKTPSVLRKHRMEYISNFKKIVDAKKAKYKNETPHKVPNKANTLNEIINKSALFNEMPNKDLFMDLLIHMLEFDPSKRWSVDTCLNHEYFAPYQEYISEIEQLYIPGGISSTIVKIIPCNERMWMKKSIQGILIKKEAYPWYSMRKLFHAAELYDRYLAWASLNYEVEEENDEMGRFHGKFKSIMRFYVCLYVSIKYFSESGDIVSFENLLNPLCQFDEVFVKAEQFEQFLIETVLSFQIYRKTLYEIADDKNMILSSKEMEYLLQNYCNHDKCELTIEEMYSEFLKE